MWRSFQKVRTDGNEGVPQQVQAKDRDGGQQHLSNRSGEQQDRQRQYSQREQKHAGSIPLFRFAFQIRARPRNNILSPTNSTKADVGFH